MGDTELWAARALQQRRTLKEEMMKRHRHYQFTTSIAGHDFAFQGGDVVQLAADATLTRTWRGWLRAGIVEPLGGVPTPRTPVRTIDPARLEPRTTQNVTPGPPDVGFDPAWLRF
jgi:hypothetical protein